MNRRVFSLACSLTILTIGALFSDATTLLSSAPRLPSSSSASWATTGSMATPRRLLGLALLQNGSVLAAGGWDKDAPGYALASVELYDPTRGTWTPTGSLNAARFWFGNLVVLNSGKVLVASGTDGSGANEYYSAELYDPSQGTWSYTGSVNTRRRNPTLTLLNDGRVLLAGGRNGVPYPCSGFVSSAELYDPSTGTWSYTGSLSAARESHQAVRLAGGNVLIAGGYGPCGDHYKYGEVYNPALGTWSVTGPMTTGSVYGSLTLLPSGKVLLAGGETSDGTITPLAQLFDPGTGAWSVTGSMNVPRWEHTATLLNDGRVLIAGGYNTTGELASSEIYDPATGLWTAGPDLQQKRREHAAVGLPNGKVLVTGGQAAGVPTEELASSELYSPTEAWTLMFYLDGDTSSTDGGSGYAWDISIFNQLESVANNPNIQMLAVLDGPAAGDSVYYHIKYDTDPQKFANYARGVDKWLPQDLNPTNSANELNMGDPQTLVDFANWSRANYPAQHYALILVDHGGGLGGSMYDGHSTTNACPGTTYDCLTVKEMGSALAAITNNGSNKIDVLFLDACLMGVIDDAYQVRGSVNYYVANENEGWMTASFSGLGSASGATTPVELAKLFANGFADSLDAVWSRAQVPYAIAVYDLSKTDTLSNAVAGLAQLLYNLMPSHASDLVTVRSQVQHLDINNDSKLDAQDDYVDLYDWARLVKAKIPDSDVQTASQLVMDAVSSYVPLNRTRSCGAPWFNCVRRYDLSSTHGVALFFPATASSYYTLASYDFAGRASWPRGASRGPNASQQTITWGDLLVSYFQTTRPGGPDNPAPAAPVPMLPLSTRSAYLPFVTK